MNVRLLVIDPQNDFCDIEGAALPVPGANADMTRLAGFIEAATSQLTDIVVTLDSHASVGIERPGFWTAEGGADVPPFTTITAQDVSRGRFMPRDASRTAEVVAYLTALEQGNNYTLMVWPTHCVLGTWGHNIQLALSRQLAAWEFHKQRQVEKVLKGINPLTEQYSAVRAEVPRDDDPRTQTNTALVDRVTAPVDWLVVAGEASSHCVSATMRDIFPAMSAQALSRTILLRDAMSPVSGFETAQDEFFAEASGLGAWVLSIDEARSTLGL
jgi:nicotinamidase/pyrazinamidase